MAYYSGQAASYQELLDVLVSTCIDHGWTLVDGILSKDDCFIELKINSMQYMGITATGGTAKSGSNLLGKSPASPRLGSPHPSLNQVIFPAFFHIFIFESEVYLIVKFNINKFFYLSFGKSDISLPASGLWISATAYDGGGWSYNNTGIYIDEKGGMTGTGDIGSPAAPFWIPGIHTNSKNNSVINHGLDGVSWSSSSKKADFVSSLNPIHIALPSSWASDSALLPINIYIERPEQKISLVCQFQNSRFLRIDNFDPEQIIQLGDKKWMIFPFFQKNIQSRNGGNDTTGTFGWAIRYDGP